MALFKTKEQREAERRMKVRRAKMRLSRQVAKLAKERERYLAMGQEAARTGKTEKVRMLARAVLQFRRMEKRFQDVLLTLEMFEAQKEMMAIQGDFVTAMKACTLSIRDAGVTAQMGRMEEEFQRALELSEQANEQVDLFLESAGDGIADTESTESEELAALTRDIMQGAQAAEAGATPDTIDEGIQAIQNELKKEV